MAITFTNLALEEPSTVTARVATVQIARGSTSEQQEILVLGDPESSLGLARVLATPPPSTAFGAVVRIASGPSSAADFQVRPAFSSTHTDNPVRALLSSTFTDNPVRALLSSTNTDNPVRAVLSSTHTDNLVRPVFSSTHTDNPVRALLSSTSADNPVTARLLTSSGGALEGSTAAPAAGVLALPVRSVLPALLSTRAVITSSNSTAVYTLVSSAADPLRHKVFAYSLTSTETTPSTFVFLSSNTIDRWAVSFGSGSSGVTGAISPGISPPAWLFQTDANNALRCLIEKGASTQCSVTLAWSYFTEA